MSSRLFSDVQMPQQSNGKHKKQQFCLGRGSIVVFVAVSVALLVTGIALLRAEGVDYTSLSAAKLFPKNRHPRVGTQVEVNTSVAPVNRSLLFNPRVYNDPAVNAFLHSKNTSHPNVLVVISRYDEDLHWLIDPSTGAPLLPVCVYQLADVDPVSKSPSIPGVGINETHRWPSWAAFYAQNPDVNAPKESTAFEFDGTIARKAAEAAKQRATRLVDGSSQYDAAPPQTDTLPVFIPSIISELPVQIIPNRGFEALAILTAIIDAYSNPPDLMLFMQGHRFHWHTVLGQDWILRRLFTIPPRSIKNGYMALQCIETSAPDQKVGQSKNIIYPTKVDKNWESPNGPWFHESLAGRYSLFYDQFASSWLNMELPEVVEAPCCSTFIVTRESILQWPIEFYIELRKWLLLGSMDSKWSAIVLEHAWHTFFTQARLGILTLLNKNVCAHCTMHVSIKDSGLFCTFEAILTWALFSHCNR